jgi:uncharacterized protein YidB (DUF937 family)
MGLLDSLLGGNQARGRGGMSPLTLGLLALLAYRTYQGKGRLADMLGRSEPGGPNTGTARSDGRVSGPGRLPDGNPAGPLGGDGGGLGGILRDILGGGAGGRRVGGAGGMAGGGLGDLLRGGLGGLLGGAAAGTVLNGGLGDLMRRMQQNGYSDAADSWVGRGPNREIGPQELEAALGHDTVQELADQSGRPYMDVLSELSQSLPDTVDQLTPDGRLPNDDEARGWL